MAHQEGHFAADEVADPAPTRSPHCCPRHSCRDNDALQPVEPTGRQDHGDADEVPRKTSQGKRNVSRLVMRIKTCPVSRRRPIPCLLGSNGRASPGLEDAQCS